MSASVPGAHQSVTGSDGRGGIVDIGHTQVAMTAQTVCTTMVFCWHLL